MYLKELRTGAGFSRRELAELLDISSSAISKYESGERRPSISAARKLGAAFGVDPYELLRNIYEGSDKDGGGSDTHAPT